jgi:4-hydroxybenzoate polyprenyltransferase
MKYPFEIKELARFFVHAFNPGADFSAWASTGLRIEFFMIIFLMALYVHIKTSKLWKSVLGFIAGYIWIMFLAMPLYAAYIIDWLPIPNSASGSVYERVYWTRGLLEMTVNKFSLIWLFATVTLLICWLYIYNKKIIVSLLRNIRPFRTIHYLGLMIGGMLVGSWALKDYRPNPFQYPFDYIAVAGLAFAVFFAFQYAVVSNDIADEEIDKLSNPERPLIRADICKEDYRSIGGIFLALSLYFAFSVNLWAFLLILLFIVCYQIYSVPPLRIKRLFPFSTFLVAFNGLVAMLAGFSLLSGSEKLYVFPPYLALAILISFFLNINMKDIKDVAGDRKAGIKTIPTVFGEKKGRIAIGVLSFTGFVFVPVILKIKALFPYTLAFGGLSALIIIKKKWQESLFFVNYYVYYVIVLFFIWRQYNA